MKKRKVSILTLILVFVFLVSGCGKQVNIKDTFNPEDNTVSFLNQLAEYQYTDTTGIANVKLDNITIQLDKSMGGKAASVYKVEYNADKLTELTNQAFSEEYKASFEKTLNEALTNILSDLSTNTDTMIAAKDIERAEKLKDVIVNIESLQSDLTKNATYTVDDMIKRLNEVRAIIETYGNENINNRFTDIENKYKELNNISDMFDILYNTYIYGAEHIGSASDYQAFYKSTVAVYSDEMLRHADVYNKKDTYTKFASESILSKSKIALPFLPIASGEGNNKDIANTVKNNPDLMNAETFSHLAAVALAYRDAYAKDALKQDSVYEYYKDIKKTLDNIKSLELQDSINKLNTIKEKVTKEAKKDADNLIKKSLAADIKKLAKDQNSSVKFSKTDSNANAVFAIFTFKKINDLHSDIYVGTTKDALSDPTLKSYIVSDLLKTKAKIYADGMGAPEIDAAITLHEKLRYEIDSLNLYVISLEVNDIKKAHEKNILTIEKAYDTEIATLVQTLDQSFEGKTQEQIANDYPQIEQSIVSEIGKINAIYKTNVDTEMDAFLKDIEKIYNEKLEFEKNYQAKNEKDIPFPDKKGVIELLDVVKSYKDFVTKAYDQQETQNSIEEIFNKKLVAYTYFEQQLPASVVIEVEGTLFNKLNRLGNIDTKTSYQTNATSSAKNSVRINAAVDSAMFVFEVKSFGALEWKILWLALIVILIALTLFSRKLSKKILLGVLLVTISVIVIYPVLWIIGSSLVAGQALNSVGVSPFPKEVSFIQFKRLFLTTDYVKWYINTFKIAMINMTLSVLLTVSTAYVFSRFKFKGKKAGMMTMMILQIFPSFLGMVAIYSLLSSIKIFSGITGTESLIDTHFGLILVYACGQIPYNVWLVKGYFDTIPKSLDEAARIDGASNIRTFVEIILPLGKPIIAFVAVTNFMGPWFDFIFPRLILKTQENKTLAIGLYEMINGREANNFTMFAAGAVLVAVPITALFAYFQKYIVTGLASGAVKG